jgi:hypothetical protein
MRLLEQLQALPDDWGLVAVGANKRAYQKAWQNNPLTKEQAAAEITAGRALAIGVLAGPASGGLLFVDHDGISANAELERLGLPTRSLPKSVSFTSGRDGRYQIIYRIPPEYWPSLRNRRVFYTGKLDDEGKKEQVDLRWQGHYSVVIGHHPQTSGYRWFRGTSPADRPVADAPLALIELLLDAPEPEPAPLLAPLAQSTALPPTSATAAPLPLLDFITRDSRELIESGGTPGSWNDDQLRLALDLRGTETWILAQGHRPDISAAQAFEIHIANARGKAPDFDDRKAWFRFNGADNHAPTPGTPVDKLQQRLAFHTRPARPLLPPPRATQQEAGAPERTPAPGPFSPEQTTTAATTPAPAPLAPAFAKPNKLEAGELLAMLRTQAQGGRIRYNTFSQLIEVDGKQVEGSERFYLSLAEQGYKVSKELAVDCLVQVARENPYDPVRLYLEHVECSVAPAYIGGLATAYLRPEDAAAGPGPTLYDHMLRCTLIGAVRRVFEPGCKHDTACVLLGDQGARKSSFWAALGGAFFSDALGDISSKDDLMVLHRSWLMEWAELDHIMGRKHAGQIKSFLSQSTDLFRVPYGKATEAFPRRGIIVGSTNRSTGFLQDDTGNRRFWVIPVSRSETNPIDTPTLLTERDAIWAAAVAAYRAGEPNYLPPELAQQVNHENEGYLVENPWTPAVIHWLEARMLGEHITTERILHEAVEKPIERQTRADQMAVAEILRTLGYQRNRAMVAGQRAWRWSKTS